MLLLAPPAGTTTTAWRWLWRRRLAVWVPHLVRGTWGPPQSTGRRRPWGRWPGSETWRRGCSRLPPSVWTAPPSTRGPGLPVPVPPTAVSINQQWNVWVGTINDVFNVQGPPGWGSPTTGRCSPVSTDQSRLLTTLCPGAGPARPADPDSTSCSDSEVWDCFFSTLESLSFHMFWWSIEIIHNCSNISRELLYW